MTPLVEDPYTILSKLKPQQCWYTVLDLKDAFFTIPIHEKSQPIFAFTWEWEGKKTQLTWTRLAQGFIHSPTIFAEVLARDLQQWNKEDEVTLIQFVDDLLIATPIREQCEEATISLLQHLHQAGYKVSREKAQLVEQKVSYLGFTIEAGSKALTPERVKAICATPEPNSRRALRGFLGMCTYCRQWIPDFATHAQPLYEATKGGDSEPFVWGEEQRQGYQALKESLIHGSALGLPDVSQPFVLFVAEKDGIAKGVLTQKLGGKLRPCAYLSKRLDGVARGWPPCLRAVAGCAVLLQDARKLTFAGHIIIRTPHSLRSLLAEGGLGWLTNSRILKYQMVLLEDSSVELQVCNALNPASFLPDEEGQPWHDCKTTVCQTWKPRPDLLDVPLKNPEEEWFTDGTSQVRGGVREAGYAIVSQHKTVEAASLPNGTSAQLAELIAVIRACQLAKGKVINLWTDSKFVHSTVHANAQLYKEKGMQDARGKPLKYKAEIENLLSSIQLPKQIALMHCRGHQKGDGKIERGNRAADSAAKQAAKTQAPQIYQMSLLPELEPILEQWWYGDKDHEIAQQLKAKLKNGKYILPDKRLLLPCQSVGAIVQAYHESTHAGGQAMYEAIRRVCYASNLSTHARAVAAKCATCEVVNQKKDRPAQVGTVEVGIEPLECLQVDFTEMKREGRFKYLLVAVCTLTGWVQAKPTGTEQAREVVKWLLQEHIPNYGLPRSINSDQGTHFIASVVQGICKALGIQWRCHVAQHPQSSGKVERMNRTIKEHVTKMMLETNLGWVELLPQALFKIRNTPYGKHQLTPYEAVYGRPSPIWKSFKSVHGIPRDVVEWGKTIMSLRKHLVQQIPLPLVDPTHTIEPGDYVLIRKFKETPLTPKWKGPYQVMLVTPTAVKCFQVKKWIHCCNVKKVRPPSPSRERREVQSGEWKAQPTGDLRIKLTKKSSSSQLSRDSKRQPS